MYSLSVCRSRGHLAYVIHDSGLRKAFKVEKDKAETLKDRLATLVDYHIQGLNKLAALLEETVAIQGSGECVVLETTSKKVYEWLARSNVSKEDEALYESLVVAFNKVSMPVSISYVGFGEVRAARYVTSKFVKESVEENASSMRFSRAVDIF